MKLFFRFKRIKLFQPSLYVNRNDLKFNGGNDIDVDCMFSSVSFLRSWRIDDHQRNCVGKRNESEAIAIHFRFNNNKKKQNKHIRHFLLFFLSIIMLLFFLMYFIYLAALLNICVVWATAVATHTWKKQTNTGVSTNKEGKQQKGVGGCRRCQHPWLLYNI